MNKTIFNNSQKALINKVVSDEQNGLIKSKEYWKQFAVDEMNLLQAVFYAVRNGVDTGETVDNDLDEVIKQLNIGVDRIWGIIDLPTEYVADLLKQSLNIFK